MNELELKQRTKQFALRVMRLVGALPGGVIGRDYGGPPMESSAQSESSCISIKGGSRATEVDDTRPVHCSSLDRPCPLPSLPSRAGAAPGLHRRRGARVADPGRERFRPRQREPGYLDLEERPALLLRQTHRRDAHAAEVHEFRDGRRMAHDARGRELRRVRVGPRRGPRRLEAGRAAGVRHRSADARPRLPGAIREGLRKEGRLVHHPRNHYYVRAINGELRLWVNGEEVSGGSGAEPRTGYLCMESEGSPVEFKNIRIRELP